MPGEALITSLDSLREVYIQRQRATNNLLAALKGTSDALGKAGRSLREYVEQSPVSSAAVAQSQESFGVLRLRDDAIDPVLPELRRELKQLAAITVALKDAQTAVRSDVVDVVKLGRAYTALQASRIQDDALASMLAELEQELAQAQRALGDTFGLSLREALAEQGIELGGRPPRFEIGRFELATDFVSRTGTLSYGKNLVNKRVPLSVEQVITTFARENKAITGRNEDGGRWMEQFYSAWETVRRKRDTTEPRVSIVECFYELVLLRQARAFRSTPTKNSFVDYSRAQFAHDFFEFTSHHLVEHKGMRAFGLVATKSQTENADRSIWIVEGNNPRDGRYIADVKFDRDE